MSSIPGLAQLVRIWCCHELWCRLHMRLRSQVTVAVAQAGGYSSNWTPSLGTSICRGRGSRKGKKTNNNNNNNNNKINNILTSVRTDTPTRRGELGNVPGYLQNSRLLMPVILLGRDYSVFEMQIIPLWEGHPVDPLRLGAPVGVSLDHPADPKHMGMEGGGRGGWGWEEMREATSLTSWPQSNVTKEWGPDTYFTGEKKHLAGLPAPGIQGPSPLGHAGQWLCGSPQSLRFPAGRVP